MHTGIPPERGPFVGWAEEVAALVAGLAGHRMVTAVGTGGVGKSRLAARAASTEQEAGAFELACWAPLWSLGSRALRMAGAEAGALRAECVAVGEHWTRAYADHQLAVICLYEQVPEEVAGHARSMLRGKRAICDASGIALGLDLLAAALAGQGQGERAATAYGQGRRSGRRWATRSAGHRSPVRCGSRARSRRGRGSGTPRTTGRSCRRPCRIRT
ncbi:hypothetical protein [Streptomyces xanthophaeus]